MTDIEMTDLYTTNLSTTVKRKKKIVLNDKVIEVYTGVGKWLKTYRSGRLPKALKVLPSISNWEELIQLTIPENWSRQAVLQVTMLFCSAESAETFYSTILLPAIREDIQKHRKLSHHLFEAVKKALYKPTAWFRGLLFPMMTNAITVKEAGVLTSLIAKVSIPAQYAIAAIVHICTIDKEHETFNSGRCLILTALINKKFALSKRVIDCLVNTYFDSFKNAPKTTVSNLGTGDHIYRLEQDEDDMTSETTATSLPVVWHQCLLSFVSNYSNELTKEHIRSIKNLIQTHKHKMTPEIDAHIS